MRNCLLDDLDIIHPNIVERSCETQEEREAALTLEKVVNIIPEFCSDNVWRFRVFYKK